uniref:Histone deacetylase complex subunit CTI6 n=1 Tax=Aceria tosichella TaxID=561515 RepID=A0A6G1SGD0_9ACAR
MTPMRAKRNSKAPERFAADETTVDTPKNHANTPQGDRSISSSATKSMPHATREPLKVKLPKLKRPQSSLPQQIKVKITRVNGTNRNIIKTNTNNSSSGSPADKAKLETPVNNNHVIKKNNSPKGVSKDGKQRGTSKHVSHRLKDLKISLPIKKKGSDKFNEQFGFVQDPDTKLNDSPESNSSGDNDALNDLNSSFSSRNSDESAMQIIVERKTEPNNSGIRCPCGVEDDLGVMVECEKCSTWQHGHCINVCSEEDAYEGYICGYCLFPAGKHTESLQQLTVGDRFQSKFDNLELLMRKRTDNMTQKETFDENRIEFSLDELEQVVQDLKRVSNSLKVKWKLLNNDDYSAELKIWQHPIWSDNPEENLKQQQKQTVSFVGDIYKSNLRLHLSNLLSNMQKRCQLIRYKIMETQAPTNSRLDNLLMVLDDISRVVEGYSDEIRQN